MLRHIYLVLPLAGLLLAGCAVSPVALSEADIAATRELNHAYTAAWVAGDNEAVMAVFTDDAVLIPHHGDDPVEGTDAIRRHFWPPDLQSFNITEFVMDPAEVNGNGNIAYVRGRFRLTMSFTQDGETTTYANSGNYMWIVRCQSDGNWKASRLMWNDSVPQQQ